MMCYLHILQTAPPKAYCGLNLTAVELMIYYDASNVTKFYLMIVGTENSQTRLFPNSGSDTGIYFTCYKIL